MSDTYAPHNVNEVEGFDLALDDYVNGINEASFALESITSFKVALESTPGDISQYSFRIIQNFINGTNKHLGFPNEVVTTLEYYNNRPLKELALESLSSIFKTIIDAIKATFKFIINGIKSIFGISSPQKEENITRQTKAISKKTNKIKDEIHRYVDPKKKTLVDKHAAFFGSEKPLELKALKYSLLSAETALKDMMDSPEKLIKILKKLNSNFSNTPMNSELWDRAGFIMGWVDEIYSSLELVLYDPFLERSIPKDLIKDAKGITWVYEVAAGYRVIAIKKDGSAQDIVANGVKPSSEVYIDVFENSEQIISRVESLSEVARKFSKNVESTAAEMQRYCDFWVDRLKKVEKEATSEDKVRPLIKLVRTVTDSTAKYSKLFAKVYSVSCQVREKANGILSNSLYERNNVVSTH